MKQYKKSFSKIKKFCRTSLPVGWFLASRQLKRSNIWTTFLIIFIMTMTFLNLVVVNGVLIGLVEGSSIAYRAQYSGDLIISDLKNSRFIENTNGIKNFLSSLPEVKSYSGRTLVGGKVESNYKTKASPTAKSDEIGVVISGINPEEENQVTGLKSLVVEGEYLSYDDSDGILIGSNLLARYSRGVPGNNTIGNAEVGTKVRLILGGITKEVKIKGVVKSKIGNVGQRIYMLDSQLRKLIGRPDKNVNEIAVDLVDTTTPAYIKQILVDSHFDHYALIQTWEESQGSFFKDLATTFVALGAMIGSIGIAVASITVFIVIFINAVTRRKYIGILKGIGICGLSIEISYIIQSLFYAVVGSSIGLLLLYGLIKPYLDKNPIDFPFSDGILVAPLDGTLLRIGILLFITLLAGYIPARLIVKKNTLNSILGR